MANVHSAVRRGRPNRPARSAVGPNIAPGAACGTRQQPGHSALVLFFFQPEDGIRGGTVTGVQTCALPISPPVCGRKRTSVEADGSPIVNEPVTDVSVALAWSIVTADGAAAGAELPGIESADAGPIACEIGRASCRERMQMEAAGEPVGNTE